MPRSITRRLVGGAVLTGGVLGAALFGGIAPAFANEDPAANPPNCSAADLEGVRAGVSASTSAYLFTHPDLNGYVSTLSGLPREEVAKQTQGYLAQHPQEQAEMAGIRQPLMDIKERCGAPPPAP
ncbi:heme-binding protein [Mycolicibacterium sediminis]|uniref:Membrane protein n=1 Tax=Mycolicibacterium sediminis TaxID=1286180 RepID=A0A7I7QJY3_9MYCO|nr:heme-binding protein [Mycolicibacterium sediminis]BBY26679.1 membrane protein [Mycolicibacterium sediminis]